MDISIFQVITPILLAICAYFLREIHIDFKSVKHEVEEGRLSHTRLEEKVSAMVQRLHILEEVIHHHKTDK